MTYYKEKEMINFLSLIGTIEETVVFTDATVPLQYKIGGIVKNARISPIILNGHILVVRKVLVGSSMDEFLVLNPDMIPVASFNMLGYASSIVSIKLGTSTTDKELETLGIDIGNTIENTEEHFIKTTFYTNKYKELISISGHIIITNSNNSVFQEQFVHCDKDGNYETGNIEDEIKKQCLFKSSNDYYKFRPDPQLNQFLENLTNKERYLKAKMEHNERIKMEEMEAEHIRLEIEMNHLKEIQSNKADMLEYKHQMKINDTNIEVAQLAELQESKINITTLKHNQKIEDSIEEIEYMKAESRAKDKITKHKHNQRLIDSQAEIERMVAENNIDELIQTLKVQTREGVGYLKVEKTIEDIMRKKHEEYHRRGTTPTKAARKENIAEKIIRQLLI